MNEHEKNNRKNLGGIEEDLIDDQVSLQFTARTVIQLGRQSISSSITAIAELVKNAYDADAEIVSLLYSGIDSDSSLMVIEDDGIGMTETQFRENWLTIGTVNKLLKQMSTRKNRVLTGEKGLGRLGLDRLCQRTVIRTFSEDQSDGIELDIDWGKYEEQADAPVHEVTHTLKRIPKRLVHPVTGIEYEYAHGTQLILYGLKDKWADEYFTRLRDELSLLVSPFSGINDFLIELDTGLDLPDINGFIESKHLLELAEWHVLSTVDEEGVINHQMTSDFFDKSYEQLRVWRDIAPFDENVAPLSGPLQFEFYFYGGDGRQTDDYSISRHQIRQFLHENQGMRVYRDHFRVKPYGQPDGQGDWLALSLRKTRSPGGVVKSSLGSWRVGYNQAVGAIFIGRDPNPDLVDQTNREGIVEGPAFLDMRKFALDAVRFFERHRQEFEKERADQTIEEVPEFEIAKQSAEESVKESTEVVGNLQEIVDAVQQSFLIGEKPSEQQLDNLKYITRQVEESIEETRQRQDQFARAAEADRQALKEQKDTLGNLASLGILVITFGHETRASTNIIQAAALDVTELIKDNRLLVMPDVIAEVDEDLDNLTHHAARVETFAEFTLQNVSRDKRRRVDVYLNEVVSQVFNYFEISFEEQNIDVQLDLQESVPPIRAFQIDWESILVNFISNSVWALSARTAQEGRIMRVSLKEQAGELVLRFADSGIGITVEPLSDIFRPGISEKKNERGDVIGTGMGLYIVKSLVESHPGGEISVVEQCDLGGAEFRIAVRVSDKRGRRKE